MVHAEPHLQSSLHDFRVVEVASGLINPHSMVFTPEGDLLVTERPGRMRIIRDGVLLPDSVAGLPDIILHGTATLALAVSRIVDTFADGDPTRITRLGGRFAAMVLMPSTITLQAHRSGNIISYEVLTEDGQPAISQGFVCLGEPT